MEELVARLWKLTQEREHEMSLTTSLSARPSRVIELEREISKQQARITHQKQVEFIRHNINLFKEMKEPDRDTFSKLTARYVFADLAEFGYAVYEDGECGMYPLHEDPHPRYNSIHPVYKRRPVPFKGTFDFSVAHAIASNARIPQKERVESLEGMLRTYAEVSWS
jgi:hypothetical protein